MKKIPLLLCTFAVSVVMAEELGVTTTRFGSVKAGEPIGEATAPFLQKPARAANQQFNLPPIDPKEPRINIEDFLAWPKNVGDAHVALWRGNAIGALSFNNDDNHWVRDPIWVEFSEKYPDIKMTHFAHGPADKISETEKEAWRKLVALGHEVQAHTYLHPARAEWDTLNVEQMRRENEGPIHLIEEVVPGHKVKVSAASAPYQWQIANHYYAGVRSSAGFPNQAATTNYLATASFSGLAGFGQLMKGEPNAIAAIKSVYDTNYTCWGGKYCGGWSSVHFHGYPKGELKDTELTFDDLLRDTVLPAMNEDKLWVARFSDIILYAQSRDTSKIEVTRNSPKEIAFVLTDLMDDEVYDRPLTVKVRIPNDWKAVSAKQAGKKIEAKLVEHEGNKYAFVEATPDRGETVIAP